MSKFQEELDVLAFNQRELDNLQKELNELSERIKKSHSELMGLNYQRNIEWEKVSETKPLEIQLNNDQSS